jgi:hypothetical protein
MFIFFDTKRWKAGRNEVMDEYNVKLKPEFEKLNGQLGITDSDAQRGVGSVRSKPSPRAICGCFAIMYPLEFVLQWRRLSFAH